MKLRLSPRSGIPMNFATNILRARQNAHLTQGEAAKLVYLGQATRWAEYENGVRTPDQARWELFLLKTHQHTKYTLVKIRETP